MTSIGYSMGMRGAGIAFLVLAACRTTAPPEPHVVATFSIVAHDPRTGDLGIAVASKFLAVGAVVPWAEAGVGAVATQAFANVDYGPQALALMARGKTAGEALAAVTEADPRRDRRQAGIVDAKGGAATFTGSKCHAWAGGKRGKHWVAQGNILAGAGVLDAMGAAFEKARASGEGELAEWLMAALRAGDAAGGDKRGRQSAALLVVRKKGGFLGGNDRYIDLRVDDHRAPVGELERLVKLHRKVFRRR
jgi:uncharacterized Ntn-hydrolase superfamily protein